jgi:uncharacterized protein YacL
MCDLILQICCFIQMNIWQICYVIIFSLFAVLRFQLKRKYLQKELESIEESLFKALQDATVFSLVVPSLYLALKTGSEKKYNYSLIFILLTGMLGSFGTEFFSKIKDNLMEIIKSIRGENKV